jgi:coproporphyrinogen III oxidase
MWYAVVMSSLDQNYPENSVAAVMSALLNGKRVRSATQPANYFYLNARGELRDVHGATYDVDATRHGRLYTYDNDLYEEYDALLEEYTHTLHVVAVSKDHANYLENNLEKALEEIARKE